jgi:hypothetical protein
MKRMPILAVATGAFAQTPRVCPAGDAVGQDFVNKVARAWMPFRKPSGSEVKSGFYARCPLLVVLGDT